MPSSKSSAISERRAARRQRVAYRLDVMAGDGSIGCILDVSASGLRARFKPTIDVGTVETLRIEFPKWLELGASVEVTGRFVWVRMTSDGATEGGFAFAGLSRKVEGIVELLVTRLAEALFEDRSQPS
jgi:hypothetical protein